MQLFYSTHFQDNLARLDEEETQHLARTLRKQVGDEVHVFDGLGNLYQAKILSIERKSCVLQIEKRLEQQPPRAVRLHLAVAPTKNIDRIEYMFEKAIEIGVERFTPILCSRSERKQIRVDRLEKIALAACKQSLQLHIPKIDELTPFGKLLEQKTANQGFIAYCGEHEKVFLHTALDNFMKQNVQTSPEILICIGAEGDFTEVEVEAAVSKMFTVVTLGNTRLRTETAGLVAVSMLATILNL